MLAPDAEAPVVTETTVRPDLLQPLKVVTDLRVHSVGKDLRVLAIDDILLPVEEPSWNFILCRILNDCNNSLQLVRVKVTSTEKELLALAEHGFSISHRLVRSTSAFLQTMLA